MIGSETHYLPDEAEDIMMIDSFEGPEKSDPIKFVITKTTKTYIWFTTAFWKPTKCRQNGCLNGASHYHPEYDPDTKEKDQVLVLAKKWCIDMACGHAPAVHAHVTSGDTIEPPIEVLLHVFGSKDATMNDVPKN